MRYTNLPFFSISVHSVYSVYSVYSVVNLLSSSFISPNSSNS